ncbi:Uncharacterized protein DAT39_011328 [Clarias magur]|uniref:Uncharacterized protein n=1 Tax=Clarias magur TaxID=1594786 RepID=A0A8J4X2R4_CLAMG|nr:Uncharacterized protein DAT39_011328 [Clarias magur]
MAFCFSSSGTKSRNANLRRQITTLSRGDGSKAAAQDWSRSEVCFMSSSPEP